MGLFSKTKIVVGSSTAHLVEAGQDQVQDAIVAAILQSGVPYISHQDIPATILKSLFNGFGVKMPRMHKYAKDDYKLGLPTGETMFFDPIDDEDLVPYIVGETGYTNGVLVTDHAFVSYTPGIAIHDFLINTRGYDYKTDLITNLPEDLTWHAYWGRDASHLERRVALDEVVANADNLTVTIYYKLEVYRPVWVTSYDDDLHRVVSIEYRWVEEPDRYSETTDIPGADGSPIQWSADCIFASYLRLDTDGLTLLPGGPYYWFYFIKDGLYPELHPGQYPQVAEYLPVVPLRYKNVDLTDASTQNNPPDPTNLFSTSKKMLDILGLDMESIGTRINENPDVGDIDHAYIMWGVDVNTENQAALYYLTEYFDDLHQSQFSNELDFLAALADPDYKDEPVSIYTINSDGKLFSATAPEDVFTEYGLILEMQYDYITSESSTGTLGRGKIGTATKALQSYEVTINTTVQEPAEMGGGTHVQSHDETRYKLVLKAQVAPNTIKTVTVFNLQTRNWIYGSKHVETNLRDVFKAPDENSMVIPLRYQLADTYPLRIRTNLYADSTILVLNSVEKIKLKWYQTGFFRFVLIVVSIIIAIWSGGAGAFLTKLAAAYAAYGIVGVILFLAVMAGISMAINTVVDWIIEQYGAKLGIIGAVVLLVVSMVLSRGTANPTPFLMTTAQTMLQVSSALISSANEFLIEEGAKIKEEFVSFMDEMDGLWETLEDLQDLVEFKADVDPLLFTKPNRFMIVPHETPTQFFQRSLGLVENTMFTIHDDIYNFMDMRLKLDRSVSKEMQQMNLYGQG